MENKVYIELGAAINSIRSLRGNCDHRFYDEGLMDACSELIGLKPSDVKPVKYGEWKEPYDAFHDMVEIVCSCCGRTGAKHFKYCPSCGAKMDGKEK